MALGNKIKKSLAGGATVTALAGALVVGGVVNPVTQVFAEAVRVEAPQAPSFADVVEAVSPAVVSVRVTAKIEPASNNGPTLRGFGFDNLPENHPFRRFFKDRPGGDRNFDRRRDRRGGQRGPRRFGSSQGSGFFVSDDGYIVTNNHVVENGSEFTVVMDNGDQLEAKLIGTDPKTDLAVLKVDEKRKFTYVSFADKKSRVGEWVVAVGNPFGLGGTVTAGIVSASGRDIGSGPYDDFIQIDAAVNKGNSGGPAFDLNGAVIGVNTAIFSPSGGNVGIAFAISANTASEVVDDLIRNGSVTRGWLGVQIQPVTKDIAESVGLETAAGTIVADAQSDAPAAKAGIKSGDVILEVDGKGVKGPKELARIIAGFEPRETVALTVFRDGEKQKIEVTLGSLPGEKKQAALQPEKSASDENPVSLEDFGLEIIPSDQGVQIADVMGGSPAAEKGLRPGDVIVSVNGRSTETVADVGRAVARALENDRKAVLFQVKSGDRNRFVALPTAKG